jgi:hypothetical protein
MSARAAVWDCGRKRAIAACFVRMAQSLVRRSRQSAAGKPVLRVAVVSSASLVMVMTQGIGASLTMTRKGQI